MDLKTSQSYAAKIVEWLSPYCAESTRASCDPGGRPTLRPSIVTAGSIRRERPVCNDIDLVCLPKTTEEKDLLGETLFVKNHLYDFLADYAKKTPGAKIVSGNTRGKQMILDLPKCQLDLWFADEKTFATRLLCRTGSMEHNIWLAIRAKRQSKKWNPYEGILTGGYWTEPVHVGDQAEYCAVAPDGHSPSPGGEGGLKLNQFATEAELYAALDLPFIEPQNRELDYLVKNFGQ